MSTHNICFIEKWRKLSQNNHEILFLKSSLYKHFIGGGGELNTFGTFSGIFPRETTYIRVVDSEKVLHFVILHQPVEKLWA